jgi:hypothetical protein
VSIYADLGNPFSKIVKDALTRKCEVCRAKPGEHCTNTILNGHPLHGRIVHYARATE